MYLISCLTKTSQSTFSNIYLSKSLGNNINHNLKWPGTNDMQKNDMQKCILNELIKFNVLFTESESISQYLVTKQLFKYYYYTYLRFKHKCKDLISNKDSKMVNLVKS